MDNTIANKINKLIQISSTGYVEAFNFEDLHIQLEDANSFDVFQYLYFDYEEELVYCMHTDTDDINKLFNFIEKYYDNDFTLEFEDFYGKEIPIEDLDEYVIEELYCMNFND